MREEKIPLRGKLLFSSVAALLVLLLSVTGSIAWGSMADGSPFANNGEIKGAPRMGVVSAKAANACPPQGPGGEIRVEFTGATYQR